MQLKNNFLIVDFILHIIRYKDLLYYLSLRDLKVRYKNAFLGLLWTLLTPVLLALIFWLVFDLFLKIHTGNTPYLLLVFTKLTFWNFFNQGVIACATSVTSSQNLISRSSFPKELLVVSTILAKLVDLAASFLVLFLLMVYYQINLSLHFWWFFPILLLEIVLVLGIGLLLSSVNVYLRDVTVLLPLVLTAWLFITPIFYTIDMVPDRFHWLLMVNPMTGIIENLRRSLLLSQPPDVFLLTSCLVATGVIFYIGLLVFHKLKIGFADIV